MTEKTSMGDSLADSTQRRRLLCLLLASPALAVLPRELRAEAAAAAAEEPRLDRLLNVADFEAVARAKLPPAHFGYLATGADDDRTVALNHEAYSHLQIRSHRFVDVSHLDTTRTVFGKSWASPLYLSAVSGMRSFHPEAEPGAARAAATRKVQFMASSFASASPQDIAAARGEPVWQQIYATNDWNVTRSIIERAEAMGSTAIALTVDLMPGRNTETMFRAMRSDQRDCTLCHPRGEHKPLQRASLYAGLDLSKATEDFPTAVNWDYLKRVRDTVKGKLIVKGIVTGEDAVQCVKHGADGIVVSNHGGRDEETLRPTIECLPEVVAAVNGRLPVFIDGGIRRGTDIYKALALGATAVGIGRPYAWGLAGFGQPGVEAIIDILLRELRHMMRQAGTPALAAITPAAVNWSRY
jgi:4-hydroxymandelate oxidase